MQPRVDDDAGLKLADPLDRDDLVPVRNRRPAVEPEQVDLAVIRQQLLDLPAGVFGESFLMGLGFFLRVLSSRGLRSGPRFGSSGFFARAPWYRKLMYSWSKYQSGGE
jgi:hypothetical protein